MDQVEQSNSVEQKDVNEDAAVSSPPLMPPVAGRAACESVQTDTGALARTGPELHTCELCNETFASLDILSHYSITSHIFASVAAAFADVVTIRCKMCDNYYDYSEFDAHTLGCMVEGAHDGGDIQCGVCGERLESSLDWVNHLVEPRHQQALKLYVHHHEALQLTARHQQAVEMYRDEDVLIKHCDVCQLSFLAPHFHVHRLEAHGIEEVIESEDDIAPQEPVKKSNNGDKVIIDGGAGEDTETAPMNCRSANSDDDPLESDICGPPSPASETYIVDPTPPSPLSRALSVSLTVTGHPSVPRTSSKLSLFPTFADEPTRTRTHLPLSSSERDDSMQLLPSTDASTVDKPELADVDDPPSTASRTPVDDSAALSPLSHAPSVPTVATKNTFVPQTRTDSALLPSSPDEPILTPSTTDALLDDADEPAPALSHLPPPSSEHEEDVPVLPTPDASTAVPKGKKHFSGEVGKLRQEAEEHAYLISKPVVAEKLRRCSLCNASVSVKAWRMHINGKHHKASMIRFARRPPPPSTERRCFVCCNDFPIDIFDSHQCTRPTKLPPMTCVLCETSCELEEAYTHMVSHEHARRSVITQLNVRCGDCDEDVPLIDWEEPCNDEVPKNAARAPGIRCEVCSLDFAGERLFRKHIELEEHVHYLRLYARGVGLVRCFECDLTLLPQHAPFHGKAHLAAQQSVSELKQKIMDKEMHDLLGPLRRKRRNPFKNCCPGPRPNPWAKKKRRLGPQEKDNKSKNLDPQEKDIKKSKKKASGKKVDVQFPHKCAFCDTIVNDEEHFGEQSHGRSVVRAGQSPVPDGEIQCTKCWGSFPQVSFSSHTCIKPGKHSSISCWVCPKVKSGLNCWLSHLGGNKHRQRALPVPTTIYCQTCEKAIVPEDWNTHCAELHSGVPPNHTVRCNVCAVEYPNVFEWARHITTQKHRRFLGGYEKKGVALEKCDSCDFAFLPANLEHHKLYIHTNPEAPTPYITKVNSASHGVTNEASMLEEGVIKDEEELEELDYDPPEEYYADMEAANNRDGVMDIMSNSAANVTCEQVPELECDSSQTARPGAEIKSEHVLERDLHEVTIS